MLPVDRFSTIERRSLPESIAAQLRQAILAGELEESTLPEAKLAAQMGVSRAPVREAMLQLEREGLLKFDTNGRTRVRPLRQEDLEEIVTTRVALEGTAARLAAARWEAEDSAWIRENIVAQETSATLRELTQLDMEMHEYIVARSGNSRLLGFWRCLRPQMERWLAHTHRLQATLTYQPRQITVEQHRLLLRVMESGDPEAAAKATIQHAESWREWLPTTMAEAEAQR